MYRITGKIKGIAPILFNRMLEGDLEPSNVGSKGRITVEARIEEARQKVYRNEQGLFLPGWNFKQCLLEGCKRSGLKVGRSSLARYLAAAIFPDHELYFGKGEPDFMHEHWGRRPPRTGGACIIRRPALKEGWELSFGLNVVDDRRTPAEIRRSLDEAGLLVGLGSWRPEYGRFLVIEWQVEGGPDEQG